MTPEHLTTRIERLLPGLSFRDQVLWAADCAERVLPVFEAIYPQDTRPRDAIAAARQGGKDAGYAAAHTAHAAAHAARAAHAAYAAYAAYAARAAADAAYAADAAAHAADAAAYAAYAIDAADAAAPDAQSERVWQLERLMYYLHPEQDADQHWASVCALILEN